MVVMLIANLKVAELHNCFNTFLYGEISSNGPLRFLNKMRTSWKNARTKAQKEISTKVFLIEANTRYDTDCIL